MRRRRGGGIGLFGFIIIMTILDMIADGGGLFLIGFLLPAGVMAFVFYTLFKFIKLIFSEEESSTKKSSSTRQNERRSNVNSRKSDSYVRNNKNAKIDKVLSDYFRNNVALILFDDVSISTQGGAYTTVDNLYISYKDEKVCQLKEFKSYYPKAYEKVIDALAELAQKGGVIKEEKKKEEAPQKKKELSQAEQFIDQINELNEGLSNEEITNGLYQTCELLKQIDIVDQEDGKVDPKLNKLYEYYLPILTGILEDYKRLSDSPVKGDEYKNCEVQLVKTIKLINEALKTIYNSLHESDYMNLNADINTLQSLLKQDGLVETPFKEVK